MSLTEALLTESAGMRGLEAGSNRVREDYAGAPSAHLDDFTYTNGVLSTVAPTKWTAVGPSLTVVSNKVTFSTSGTENSCMWSAAFGVDHYAEADITVNATGGYADSSVCTRMASSGDCYFAVLFTDNSGSMQI